MISFTDFVSLFKYMVTCSGCVLVCFLNFTLLVWGLPSQALNHFCNSLLNHVQFLAFILTCGQQKRTECSSNSLPRRRVQRWYNLLTAAQCCRVYTSKNPARPFCQSITCGAHIQFVKSRQVFRTLVLLQWLTCLLLLILFSIRFYIVN